MTKLILVLLSMMCLALSACGPSHEADLSGFDIIENADGTQTVLFKIQCIVLTGEDSCTNLVEFCVTATWDGPNSESVEECVSTYSRDEVKDGSLNSTKTQADATRIQVSSVNYDDNGVDEATLTISDYLD